MRFPPVVVTELLSAPLRVEGQRRLIAMISMIELTEGFWFRAGQLRAELKRQGLKADLGDVLVAQTCIDSNTPLITYDRDYRHFFAAGLKLA